MKDSAEASKADETLEPKADEVPEDKKEEPESKSISKMVKRERNVTQKETTILRREEALDKAEAAFKAKAQGGDVEQLLSTIDINDELMMAKVKEALGEKVFDIMAHGEEEEIDNETEESEFKKKWNDREKQEQLNQAQNKELASIKKDIINKEDFPLLNDFNENDNLHKEILNAAEHKANFKAKDEGWNESTGIPAEAWKEILEEAATEVEGNYVSLFKELLGSEYIRRHFKIGNVKAQSSEGSNEGSFSLNNEVGGAQPDAEEVDFGNDLEKWYNHMNKKA